MLETARLAAVRASRRGGTAHASGLDRIADAAARACAAPIGAVCLVDEQNIEFAGACGLEIRSFARRFSFCDAVVGAEAPIIVDDASVMPSFCDHELPQSYGLRAYAGVPLIDCDGYVVGTVCALAREAGQLAAAPLDDLTALACLAETMLSASIELPRARVRGWLGVKTKRAHRDGSGRAGAIVLRVARESPAERAGLKPADMLHSIDDHVLRGPDDIVAALAVRAPGDPALIRFQRRGEWMSCRVVLSQVTAPAFASLQR